MKKRYIVYAMLILFTAFMTAIVKGTDYETLSLIHILYNIWISLIIFLASGNVFTNILGWILVILISLTPIVVGLIIYRLKLSTFDKLALILLSLLFTVTQLISLNTNQVASWVEALTLFDQEFLIRTLIRSGVLNIYLSLLVIYGFLKVFLEGHLRKKNFITMLYVLSILLTVLTTEHIVRFNYAFQTFVEQANTILNILDMLTQTGLVILLEIMIIFLSKVKDNPKDKTIIHDASLAKWIGLTLLIISSLTVLLDNLFNLMLMHELTTISFNFTIHTTLWVIVIFFYGIIHYIAYMNDLVEESELTI